MQDNDSLRRGQPTNHVKYGDDIALLAGDALLAYSFEHIARETKAPPEQIVRVISEVGRAVGSIGLVGGQVLTLIYILVPNTLAGKCHATCLSMPRLSIGPEATSITNQQLPRPWLVKYPTTLQQWCT